MTKHRSTPKQHYITHLLTVAVFPIAIYLLDLVSKLSSIAALVAGVLFFLKVLLELRSRPVPAAPRAPARRQVPSPVASYPLAIVAPCSLCGAHGQVTRYDVDPRHALWICRRCHRSLSLSQRTS